MAIVNLASRCHCGDGSQIEIKLEAEHSLSKLTETQTLTSWQEIHNWAKQCTGQISQPNDNGSKTEHYTQDKKTIKINQETNTD